MSTPIANLIDELARFEPSADPVVSLYLNTQPNEQGRDNFAAFLRKEFKQRLQAFPAGNGARGSVESDFQKIQSYLEGELKPSTNGLAVFACANRDLFVPVQLDAPVEANRLYIDGEPHLYPLARLQDQFRRYAALIADTNAARIFVFSLGQVERSETVQNVKTRRSQMGGWSQNRYQRHVENFHQQHVKEVVEVLDRIVAAENIPHVIVGGDAVVVPMLKEAFPQRLAERVVDVVSMPMGEPDHAVLEKTLETFRQKDAEDDRARVEALLDEARSGGLGVVGPDPTLDALEMGQVDELLISAAADRPVAVDATDTGETLPTDAEPGLDEEAAEILVTKAKQTGASVRFIEDRSLLEGVGGVGALLRFRI